MWKQYATPKGYHLGKRLQSVTTQKEIILKEKGSNEDRKKRKRRKYMNRKKKHCQKLPRR
jgi:hypothetical protein